MYPTSSDEPVAVGGARDDPGHADVGAAAEQHAVVSGERPVKQRRQRLSGGRGHRAGATGEDRDVAGAREHPGRGAVDRRGHGPAPRAGRQGQQSVDRRVATRDVSPRIVVGGPPHVLAPGGERGRVPGRPSAAARRSTDSPAGRARTAARRGASR